VALLEWDDAWADVLTKRISHRNALHGRCDRSGHGETMEGRVTSLSAWEQQALDSIKDRLASSDPTLVARLTIFTRLASGEEMPAREEIHVGSRGAVRRSRPEPPRRRQRLGLHQAAPMLLWLVTTVCADRGRAVFQPWRQPRHMHGILGNVLHRWDIRSQFGHGRCRNRP